MSTILVSVISAFFSILMWRYYLSWKRKRKKHNKEISGSSMLTSHDNYIAIKIIGVIFGLMLISVVYLFKSFN